MSISRSLRPTGGLHRVVERWRCRIDSIDGTIFFRGVVESGSGHSTKGKPLPEKLMNKLAHLLLILVIGLFAGLAKAAGF
jgi:hypothetical protein